MLIALGVDSVNPSLPPGSDADPAAVQALQDRIERASRPAPTVAFIGDSYVGGSAMGGNDSSNLTQLMASRFNWRVLNTAVGGTGYVAAGPTAQPLEQAQLQRVVAARPALVIVMGSRNDAGQVAVESAAAKLYADLRQLLPQAKLVVVGPESVIGSPPAALTAVRDDVSEAALAAGVPFVDPLADGWFAGPAAALIGADGIHPVDAGHARMAQLLGDDLQRLNVLPD